MRDTIIQAAATPCMKVPTSEATSATSRLRKIAVRKGRQRLGVCLGFGLATFKSFLLQQNKAG